MSQYLVRTTGRARMLWVPYGGSFRWPPPRLLQLGKIAHCGVFGHDWMPYVTDDYEGPGELLDAGDPDSFMPLCNRPSRDGEYGSRHCRCCRLGQERWPLSQSIPPLVRGRVVEMES